MHLSECRAPVASNRQVAAAVIALPGRKAFLRDDAEDLVVVRDQRLDHALLLAGTAHVTLQRIEDVLHPIIDVNQLQLSVRKVKPDRDLEAISLCVSDARAPQPLGHNPMDFPPPLIAWPVIGGSRTLSFICGFAISSCSIRLGDCSAGTPIADWRTEMGVSIKIAGGNATMRHSTRGISQPVHERVDRVPEPEGKIV